MFKGWNAHVHREYPGKFESRNLSRGNLSREIGRALQVVTEKKTGSYIDSAIFEYYTKAAERRRQISGGTTCLTLLVQRRFSSKVANYVANYDDP